MNDTNYVGNITTIINWIALMILPYVSAYGMTQDVLVAILSAVVGIVFAILNSTYLNNFKFLSNSKNDNDTDLKEVA